MRAFVATALLLAASSARAVELFPPLGLTWDASPADVDAELAKSGFVPVPVPVASVETFLEERRYSGMVMGLSADHVAPLFFASRLFGVAVSFSPTEARRASALWEISVERLTRLYGKPAVLTRPSQLISWNAVLRLLPPQANRSAIMSLYNAAAKDPAAGRVLMNDLQVQVGLWIPEAIWRFTNGATVKAVMRAGGANEQGLSALKPAVLYTRYEAFR